MALFENKKTISIKWLTGLSAVVLLAILFWGLRSNGYYVNNGVGWLDGQSGIRFGYHGIAFADWAAPPSGGARRTPGHLSVEMALKPDRLKYKWFKFILVLHDGEDTEQLLIGQWRSGLILMNGNDYDGRQGIKKLAVKQAFLPHKTRFVTITSGPEGTSIYLDGRLVKTKKDLVLKIPGDGTKTRLILGNSAYGRHSWTGDIYGLAIYEAVLKAREVKLHAKRWSDERNFRFALNASPQALYFFDERQGGRAFDRAGNNQHLEIPSRMPVLKKKFLVPPWRRTVFNRSSLQDLVLNILGFIPLGFVFNMLFETASEGTRKRSCLLTISICFLVSLTIETAQAWIPSRSSDLLDLMLNTLGASLGVMLQRFYLRLSLKRGSI